MRWNYWLRWMSILIAPPIILIGELAVAQSNDTCFMQTSSGRKISLNKLCGKSGGKAMSDFMWDENNYDPKYVTRQSDGIWNVVVGAPQPFKYPDGSVLWPDGRVTEPEGYTSKLITQGEKVVGVQYYKPDNKTPLKPGEVMTLPTGQKVVQQDFR